MKNSWEKRTGLILDTFEILVGYLNGKAQEAVGWMGLLFSERIGDTDLGITCIQMGSNTMGVNEITQEDSWSEKSTRQELEREPRVKGGLLNHHPNSQQ